MKKILIPIVFIALPTLAFSQDTINDVEIKNEIIRMDMTNIHQQTENQISLRTPSVINVTTINYKKSYDLVSITAYRKSLQIRIKDVKTC